MENVFEIVFLTFLVILFLVQLFIMFRTGVALRLGPKYVLITRKANPDSFWTIVALLSIAIAFVCLMIVNSVLVSASLPPVSLTEVGSKIILFLFG